MQAASRTILVVGLLVAGALEAIPGAVIKLEPRISGVEGNPIPRGAAGFRLSATQVEFVGRNGQSLGVFPRDEADGGGAQSQKQPAPGAGPAPQGPRDGVAPVQAFSRMIPLNPRQRIVAVEGVKVPPGARGYRIGQTSFFFTDRRGRRIGPIHPRDEEPGAAAGGAAAGKVAARQSAPVKPPPARNRFSIFVAINPRERVSAVEGVPVPRGARGFRLGDTTFFYVDAAGRQLGPVHMRDEDDIKPVSAEGVPRNSQRAISSDNQTH